jgi:hypothetical protein
MYLIVPVIGIIVLTIILVETCHQMKYAVDDNDYEPYED